LGKFCRGPGRLLSFLGGGGVERMEKKAPHSVDDRRSLLAGADDFWWKTQSSSRGGRSSLPRGLREGRVTQGSRPVFSKEKPMGTTESGGRTRRGKLSFRLVECSRENVYRGARKGTVQTREEAVCWARWGRGNRDPALQGRGVEEVLPAAVFRIGDYERVSGKRTHWCKGVRGARKKKPHQGSWCSEKTLTIGIKRDESWKERNSF